MVVSAAEVFKWSEKEYSLKQLLAEYQHLLPFAIMITQGYLVTEEEKSSLSTSEVFWLHDVIKQPWIVVQDTNGKVFRIPGYHDAMVKPIKADGKEGKPIEVHQLFLRDDVKYIVLTSAHGDAADNQLPNKLRIVKRIHEELLVLHSIYTDELFEVGQYLPAIKHLPKGVVDPKFVLLPTHLPILASIALRMRSGEDHRYFYVMTDIKQIVDKYDHNYVQHMRETADILPGDLDHGSKSLNETKKNIAVRVGGDSIVPHRELDPIKRLMELRKFYNSQLANLLPILRRQKSTPVGSKPKRHTVFGQPSTTKASPDMAVGSRITQHRDDTQRKLLRQKSADVQVDERLPRVHGYRASTALDDFRSASIDDSFDLSVDEVANCLDALRLFQYKSAMREAGVDGRRLAKLQERGLQREYGFSQTDASMLMDYVKKKTNSIPEYGIPDTVRRKLPESSYVVLNEYIK